MTLFSRHCIESLRNSNDRKYGHFDLKTSSLPEPLFLLVVDSLASSREKYILKLLIFAITSATKSKSNNTLKKEGGNEKLKPKQEQRVKNRKTSGHIRRRDSLGRFTKIYYLPLI